MAVIRERDLDFGRKALRRWRDAARAALKSGNDAGSGHGKANGAPLLPNLPQSVWAMAVRYSLYLLERRAPGEAVEVRVAPWGAVKIFEGPASDPHNLTPPDVIELEPDVWLRLACGITAWDEERLAGHITAVGKRDNLSGLLPLIP